MRGFAPAALIALLLSGCGSRGGCEGPPVPVQQLQSLRRAVHSGGVGGSLVLPNPIEATRSASVMASDSRLAQVADLVDLPGLLNPRRLENDFLKVRIRDISDSPSSLASPNAQGAYNFPVSDVHYSEVMAYHSVATLTRYVEALGFSVVKTRPLYVMVRAASEDPNEINAIYDHNYLAPNRPRTMRLFGDTEFAPGMDRDMYWHEFGHLFNESASREVGMDFAGDNGAVFTEGAALHECLADAIAQSVADKPYIGRWIARNLQGFRPGEPLRQAVDPSTGRGPDFTQLIRADGRGSSPERYAVAEWCSRVLWDVRQQFVTEDPVAGAMRYERLVFSALSLVQRDTSFSEFKSALETADESLYCGGHGDRINAAFVGRGFPTSPGSLSRAVSLAARPVGLIPQGETDLRIGRPEPGATLVFDMRLQNPNGEVARNVRVFLELSQGAYTTTYMQGYGDLGPGQTVDVGFQGLDYGFSVWGEIDQRARRGATIRYRLRVESDNAPTGTLDGEFTL